MKAISTALVPRWFKKKKKTNCTFMCIFKNLTVESGRLRVNVLEREEQSTGG